MMFFLSIIPQSNDSRNKHYTKHPALRREQGVFLYAFAAASWKQYQFSQTSRAAPGANSTV